MKDSLKYFLGDTIEEAKETHDSFVEIINSISREYSISTGIDKKELFNEAFIALSRAKVNFIETNGIPFVKYAKFSIRMHLNDYIRHNSTIRIPRYIKRAIVLLRRLNNVLGANGCEITAEDYILNYTSPISLTEKEYSKYNELMSYLKNIASRANISLEKLIKRSIYIPCIKSDTDCELLEVSQTDALTKILVADLFEKLTEEEKIIANGIMEGKSKKAIAKEMNKSDTWVNSKLKEVGRKLLLPRENEC